MLQPQPSIARKIKVVAPTAAPVAILRSANTGPQDGNYAYSFETENGISQSVEGRMKMVDETPVYVMKMELMRERRPLKMKKTKKKMKTKMIPLSMMMRREKKKKKKLRKR